MSADRPAFGGALWKLNTTAQLGEALRRSPDGIIRAGLARELLEAWFAEHPEEQKASMGPRWKKRKRNREANEQDTEVVRHRVRAADLDPLHANVADMTAEELLASARRLERRRRS